MRNILLNRAVADVDRKYAVREKEPIFHIGRGIKNGNPELVRKYNTR